MKRVYRANRLPTLTPMLSNAEEGGLVLVAEEHENFVGFAAGWIEHQESLAETADSNRFWIHLGYLRPLDLSRQANRKPAS
jgi:hypothetical protein